MLSKTILTSTSAHPSCSNTVVLTDQENRVFAVAATIPLPAEHLNGVRYAMEKLQQGIHPADIIRDPSRGGYCSSRFGNSLGGGQTVK